MLDTDIVKVTIKIISFLQGCSGPKVRLFEPIKQPQSMWIWTIHLIFLIFNISIQKGLFLKSHIYKSTFQNGVYICLYSGMGIEGIR
jgi:hypothetical protein